MHLGSRIVCRKKFKERENSPYYSYWCKNDSTYYKNFRLDFSWFIYPIDKGGEQHPDGGGTWHQVYKERWKRLPPEMFIGIHEDDWPVALQPHDGERIGKWPIEVDYSSDDWQNFYNSGWLNITVPVNGARFVETYKTPFLLWKAMEQYPMGVCSNNDDITNSTVF